MMFNDVPETIEKMSKYSGENLHGMAMIAGISYATAHSWKKGTAKPNIEKFKNFLEANGFAMKIIVRPE